MSFVIRSCLIVLLIVLSVGCQNNSEEDFIRGRITKVISGQTIEVIIDDRQYQLRLTGLKTPYLSQKPWGQEARKYLMDTLMSSSYLSLETDVTKTDQYDRLQGYVWHEKQLINQKIIEEGYGVVDLTYTDGKYDQQLLNAQNYARIMGKGIWNPDKPLKELKQSSPTTSQ
jgi:micrococcal nuclease